MAVKCLNCGYKMSRWQEAVTVASDLIFGSIKKELVAGHMNNRDIKCPNCKTRGQWEDAD